MHLSESWFAHDKRLCSRDHAESSLMTKNEVSTRLRRWCPVKPLPFKSRIVDDRAELLAGTAEEWDLVRDLPGERFLIRHKVPKS